MKSKELRGSLLLLLTACIWGCAFVAQSVGAGLVGALTFQTVRSLLGGCALVPVLLIRRAYRRRHGTYQKMTKAAWKTLLIAGFCCGTALCASSLFQQFGIAYTSVGNAGFITAMYILIVPIFGLFLGKTVNARHWGCVAIAIAALYLLSVKDGFVVSAGDILMLCCAVGFSVQILLVDYFSAKVDAVSLACTQFFVAGLWPMIPMFIFDKPTVSATMSAAIPLLYTGLMSSGVAYTLQIIGQKYSRPAVASLVMSLESVFAVLAGAVLLHQIPTLRESIGCMLMVVAIIAAQLPSKNKA